MQVAGRCSPKLKVYTLGKDVEPPPDVQPAPFALEEVLPKDDILVCSFGSREIAPAASNVKLGCVKLPISSDEGNTFVLNEKKGLLTLSERGLSESDFGAVALIDSSKGPSLLGTRIGHKSSYNNTKTHTFAKISYCKDEIAGLFNDSDIEKRFQKLEQEDLESKKLENGK